MYSLAASVAFLLKRQCTQNTFTPPLETCSTNTQALPKVNIDVANSPIVPVIGRRYVGDKHSGRLRLADEKMIDSRNTPTLSMVLVDVCCCHLSSDNN